MSRSFGFSDQFSVNSEQMEKQKAGTGARNAEDLDVFRRAYALSLELHRASLSFPKIEQYGGLTDQLRRASKSVCSLIVEGSGRQSGSRKEFARYLAMAVGSAEEARLWCRYAADLGYAEIEPAEEWRKELGHVIRMLQGLKSRVERDRPSDP
jgi:four helix bundle protein